MTIAPSIITTYTRLHADHPDCVLLMQVGTFLKVFDHDARTVSQITGLALMMAGPVDHPWSPAVSPCRDLMCMSAGCCGLAMRWPSPPRIRPIRRSVASAK